MILGNQLFPESHVAAFRQDTIFMAEDLGLCTFVAHHQQKIVLILAAMRTYADRLRSTGFRVDYRQLQNGENSIGLAYEEKLADSCARHAIDELIYFEIEDKFMERRIEQFSQQFKLRTTVIQSPMFVNSRAEFDDYDDSARRPLMATFYRQQRLRHRILIEPSRLPTGGKWSFDSENRKRLPKKIEIPELPPVAMTTHVRQIQRLVDDRFVTHPGDARTFWLPTSRAQALASLNDFLDHRFRYFGDFEDAISIRSATLFHSILSPSLNIGLLTPLEVVHTAIDYAHENNVSLNSLEGFIRQIIGWREFIRGIYRRYSEKQENSNFWNHCRQLTPAWYRGDTGIAPLDQAITTANRIGWLHHIQRLMIVGNMMTLCEIHPSAAHQWFMEMFVDSSDWVMGPNVFGMALFSDGGIFATKPYICGSNYMLKMSDYKRGTWCDVVDGLYWRFIAKHLDFFRQNPRLSFMTQALQRLDNDRRQRIFKLADDFFETMTEPAKSGR